jgi:hypothetical protein
MKNEKLFVFAILIIFLVFLKPEHPIFHIEEPEAVLHFEPTLESGLTEWDCLLFEQEIDILKSRYERFQGSIKEAETLKVNILLEVSVWDTSSIVENTSKRLSEIEAERQRLIKLAQAEKDMLESINNLFKHCIKTI